MPGLFDILNMDDPQNMGLLGGAAAILNASGPSLMPRSFGQIIGAGLGGMQQAQEQQLKLAQARQLAQLNGLKLQDAQSDLNKQEADRKRATALQGVATDFWKGNAPPAMPFAGGQPAAQLFSAQMAAPDGMSGAAQPPAQPQPTQGGNRNTEIYQRRMAYAQHLRSLGYGPEAQAEEDSALKIQPKVKGWEKVQQNGHVMFAPYFEDGTSGAPVPYDVAEKLEFKSTGKETLGLNPFTGAKVSSYANTVDPNTAYTGAITKRGQDLVDARAGEQLKQGKIPAGYRMGADGVSLEAIPGGPAADKVSSPQQKVADARDVIAILDQAEPLLMNATGSYGGAALDAGARFFGKSTDGAAAAAKLKVLEGNLVSKMPKMSGPQSDKDVLMYKQMAGVIGDPTVPNDTKTAAMATIREIAERNAGGPAAPKKVDMLPSAKDHPGARYKSDNGTVYKSVNGKWVKE